MKWRSLLAFVVMLLPATVRAELRLAQIFQDNMVLQRELNVPVWGWTDPGANVTVSFAGQTKTATVKENGHWIVELDPLETSAQGQSLSVKSGNASIDRKNILVGEVWVLSGQSNMARPLRNDSIDYPLFKEYSNDAEYPLVRFTDFGMGASSVPLDDVEPLLRKDSPWKILNKRTSIEVMSIGFFFAKRITTELNVPVGLVQVAVSGTPQTAWMARQTLETFPGEKGNKSYYETALADADSKMARTKGKFKSFAEFEAALEPWRKDPAATERSWPGDGVITDYPSVLYNSRVHPLAPFAFRGMLWHQGEAGPGGPYGQRMVAMIKQHRELFRNDFHFIFGTLTRKTMVPPPMEPQISVFGQINLSMIEGDQLFGENGRAALVNFFDLGNPSTHWAMKEEAGRRMALAALDRVYGKKQIFTGPQLIDSKIDGGSVTCKFRYAGGGLKYVPSIDGISGLVIVDKKGERHWAEVKLTAPDTLVATHPKVTEAAALVYGAHSNPHETLFNAEGFPAFLFTVGQLRPAKAEDSAAMLQITSGAKDTVQLNISHVRREGYVFNVVEGRGGTGGNVVAKAYVPAEWKGLEVRAGDKAIQPGKTTEEAGRKFIELQVPIGGPSFIVAEPAHADALSKINRF